MANGRGKRKGDSQRDGTAFVALPTAVLDSSAYLGLSHPAKALMIELARQLGRGNNGRLLASAKMLGPRGWRSNDVITRALRELQGAGLIHQTVKGQRPHRASWYAVTWYTLADHHDYDAGAAQAFRRGAYLDAQSIRHKNASLTPSGGAKEQTIAPSGGVEASNIAPSGGAIRGIFRTSPTPGDGDHLDIAICMRSEVKAIKGMTREAIA
ncbi:MAG: hypothetical protein ACTHJ1_13715 [Bordetella sp.]|uniref:hypothetical protein n=1 Tax=Bordetella sp. TaxID=28081 RepID=UPI003F7CA8F1